MKKSTVVFMVLGALVSGIQPSFATEKTKRAKPVQSQARSASSDEAPPSSAQSQALAEEAKQFIVETFKTFPSVKKVSLEGQVLIVEDDWEGGDLHQTSFSLSDLDLFDATGNTVGSVCVVGNCVKYRTILPGGGGWPAEWEWKHHHRFYVGFKYGELHEMGSRLNKALVAYQNIYGKRKSSF